MTFVYLKLKLKLLTVDAVDPDEDMVEFQEDVDEIISEITARFRVESQISGSIGILAHRVSSVDGMSSFNYSLFMNENRLMSPLFNLQKSQKKFQKTWMAFKGILINFSRISIHISIQ